VFRRSDGRSGQRTRRSEGGLETPRRGKLDASLGRMRDTQGWKGRGVHIRLSTAFLTGWPFQYATHYSGEALYGFFHRTVGRGEQRHS